MVMAPRLFLPLLFLRAKIPVNEVGLKSQQEVHYADDVTAVSIDSADLCQHNWKESGNGFLVRLLLMRVPRVV